MAACCFAFLWVLYNTGLLLIWLDSGRVVSYDFDCVGVAGC